MKFQSLTLGAGLVGAAYASTLKDVCTTTHAKSALPKSGFVNGISIKSTTITASPVYNASVSGQVFFPDATFDYCNVTFAYSHTGRDDQVQLELWLPSPDKFQNRWLSTGGGGYAINSGSNSLPGGIIYGAAAGITDGGFGGFDAQLDEVFLLANGTINRDALYMFGYEAHHELTLIGKAFTKNFFGTQDKLYAYYQGCSEGGREGWSQVQRYADEWDGAVIGAPAMRYGQQQPNHLYPDIVEHTMGYYPPPCELEKIMNMTISSCDKLDGRVDGVVSRTDLCKLHFNLNTTIGASYHCAASSSTRNLKKRAFISSSTPEQSGKVTAKGVAIASKMLEGLHTLDGKRAYVWYQPSASFDDAATQYNSETKKWELDITSFGGEWVKRFLELEDVDNMSTLQNVTYDTLVDWMKLGQARYEDVLQTTMPDLTPFHSAGGKVLHFHGESDNSIPPGSSVHYQDSVRKTMYPEMSYKDGNRALADWYRLYLIPGAAHCNTNSYQPNGPFPQTTLETLIQWVESDVVPQRLNATVLQGDREGEKQEICTWPLRPLWKNNGTIMDCVYHQASIDTWTYNFDAYKLPLY
ncbi:putative tannase [Penicillium brevicompactum]|uniref:uncharacterized protein n=1 Tax=Penicillium brevicompactum TaxID=5074 RepID=UPI00253FC7E0|nr:uncharacterized protein N7506_003522 [Penicillium brevicompactum]KAJ5343698.1 hypothetical protein N7506_003522 [Penicillium brevicompactum]